MKVLAISSSPRGSGLSKTEMLLEPLIEGMKEAGAEVDIVHLRDRKIRNCIGCYTCWTKTPGICVHKDDMTTELFPKYIGSDIAVFASPLYFFSVTAGMKTFIDRTLPMAEPFIFEKNGKSFHPRRCNVPKLVMLSAAGFPDMGVFDQLSSWLRYVYRKDLIAEIYRPGAESLVSPAFERQRAEIFDALKKAGSEIVRNQSVSHDTMETITQPLADKEAFLLLANMWWRTCISEGVNAKEAADMKLIPRANSIGEFLAVLRIAFRPEEAEGVKAVIKIVFSGEVEGECIVRIGNGTIDTSEGPSEDRPDLIIAAPFGLWMDIMTQKADGAKAFIEGRYKAEGSMDVLMNFGRCFGAKG